jgi:hypothetical protein
VSKKTESLWTCNFGRRVFANSVLCAIFKVAYSRAVARLFHKRQV